MCGNPTEFDIKRRIEVPWVENPTQSEEGKMEVLYTRCCGLDVHKESITACVLTVQAGHREKLIRRVGTTTGEILELSDWLRQLRVDDGPARGTLAVHTISGSRSHLGKISLPLRRSSSLSV
jgi:hypothetical protein